MAAVASFCSRYVVAVGESGQTSYRRSRGTSSRDAVPRKRILRVHCQLRSQQGEYGSLGVARIPTAKDPPKSLDIKQQVQQEESKAPKSYVQVQQEESKPPKSVEDGAPEVPLVCVAGPGKFAVMCEDFNTINSALRVYVKELESVREMIWMDPNPAVALQRVLAKEWKIIYLLMCNDVPAAVLPFYCIGINVLAVSPSFQLGASWEDFWAQAVTIITKEALYSFLYLYSFNCSNQYNSTGDYIDKPWRPIPAGLLTRQSCLARCVLSNMFFTFVGWKFGLLPWTLLWQSFNLAQFIGAETDDGGHGLTRTLGMWAGTATLCGAGVTLATPMTPTLLSWVLLRSAQTANHHWMQDFRDVKGDMEVGRTTFPILFGMKNARRLLAFIFLLDPIFLHFAVMKDSAYTTPQLIAELVVLFLSACLAYRTLNFTTSEEDHNTYTTWLTCFWHNCCFLLVGPGLLLIR